MQRNDKNLKTMSMFFNASNAAVPKRNSHFGASTRPITAIPSITSKGFNLTRRNAPNFDSRQTIKQVQSYAQLNENSQSDNFQDFELWNKEQIIKDLMKNLEELKKANKIYKE